MNFLRVTLRDTESIVRCSYYYPGMTNNEIGVEQVK